ncbi:MAG: hypothetical protein ABJB47_13585 [Actinomycetota bacterium]
MGALAAGGLMVRARPADHGTRLAARPHTAHGLAPATEAAKASKPARQGRPVNGTDSGTGGMWSAVSAATGGLAAYRGYNTPGEGIPSSWPGPSAGPLPPGAALPVISIKPNIRDLLGGVLDKKLAAFAAQVPAGTMVTCWHEAERANEGNTTAQILGLHARCHKIFKAQSPHCLYGQMVTCYTATRASGHYPLGQWMAPGMDFYGLDGYQITKSDTVDSIFGAAARQITGALGNVPLAVIECNSALPNNRPGWFNDTWAWAQEHGCLTYLTYWDPAGSGTPYAWQSSATATISKLAAINSASKG